MNIIQDLKFDKGQAIDTVNLVGWSRGAVTCMRIANLMYEVFKDEIECNIFAVDSAARLSKGSVKRPRCERATRRRWAS